jgi:hypothetical protein
MVLDIRAYGHTRRKGLEGKCGYISLDDTDGVGTRFLHSQSRFWSVHGVIAGAWKG